MDTTGLELGDALIAARSILDRIFVPIDYSMGSQRALGVALELRRTHGSAVCLFHAIASTTSDEWLAGIGGGIAEDWTHSSRNQLERFLRNVAPLTNGIELVSAIGNPIESIREQMHEWRATLLVASANVHAILFRSAAEKLVRDIDIPVLVIPAPRIDVEEV